MNRTATEVERITSELRVSHALVEKLHSAQLAATEIHLFKTLAQHQVASMNRTASELDLITSELTVSQALVEKLHSAHLAATETHISLFAEEAVPAADAAPAEEAAPGAKQVQEKVSIHFAQSSATPSLTTH